MFEKANELRKTSTALSQAFFLAPQWMKDVVPTFIQVKVFRSDVIDSFFEGMKSIVNKHVNEGEEKLKNGTDGDDVISEYLREMEKHGDDQDSPFWRGALVQIVNDLFGAGSDTIFNMMRWTIYLMAKYPEMVVEMRAQIDSVTPKGDVVSLARKSDLPLVEAFIFEALRYSSMVVLNVQRAAARNSNIRGYFIPEGTVVQVANIHIHYDPKLWKNPHDFNPRRFITEAGNFCAPKDGFFAFGSGRRQCVGETLAKMEYFLFSATLIQNFNIKLPEGSKLETEFDDSLGLRVPKDQPLIFEYIN